MNTPSQINSLGRMSSVALLLALFLVGCGAGGGADSGGQNFVFTGTNSNTGAAPGALTFHFVKAQTPLTVPSTTAQIKFDFLSAGNVLVQQEVRDFAATLTIDPVDVRTASVVVTALSPEGFPLATATVPVQVQSNREVQVDFSAITVTLVTLDELVLTPLNASIEAGGTLQLAANLKFSNGDLLPADAVTWDATGQGDVSATGLLTGTDDGEAVVTATRDSLMASVTVIVGQGLSLSRVEILPNATPNVQTNVGSLQFTVLGFDQFDQPFAISDPVVWQITTNNSGSVIDPSGLFSGGANKGLDTVTVTVDTQTDTQTVNVIDIPGDITGVTTAPDPLNLTAPGEIQILTTVGSFENGPDAPINNQNHGLTYASDNMAVATVGAANGLVTARAQGTTTITAIANLQTDTVTVNVDFGAANQPPQIGDLGGLLDVTTTAVTAFPGATVTDDQVSLDGGTLTLSVSGLANDLRYDVDETDSTIETLNGDNTSIVTVTFNDTATPVTVQNFLRTVTVRRDVLEGSASLNVSLADRHPTHEATGMASRVVASLFLFVEGTDSPYDEGDDPTSVASGDFDGDGDLDLAVGSNMVDTSVTVLLNDGDGTFTADDVNGPYGAGGDVASVVVGDFDGDNDPDLAVGYNRATGAVLLLFNDGDGTFTTDPNGPYGLANRIRDITVGDFNGDNHTDFAITQALDGISVYLNDGDGTFTRDTVGGPSFVTGLSITVGDFDGDGFPDLAGGDGSNVFVLLNDGDGFTNSSYVLGSGTFRVAVGDLDGDNDPDLAVVNFIADTVTVLLNDGDGTFTVDNTNGPYDVGEAPQFVSIGDFNGDNDPDLAVTNRDSDDLTVLLNDGDGTFTEDSLSPYDLGTFPQGTAVGDFDADNDPDLAVANQSDVTVLINVYSP